MNILYSVITYIFNNLSMFEKSIRIFLLLISLYTPKQNKGTIKRHFFFNLSIPKEKLND